MNKKFSSAMKNCKRKVNCLVDKVTTGPAKHLMPGSPFHEGKTPVFPLVGKDKKNPRDPWVSFHLVPGTGLEPAHP
jgi:hypothetical protein